MIIDRLSRMQQYTRAVPELYEAVKFAERVKAENLPAGKYKVGRDFAFVQEGMTRSFEEGDFETHINYLDVQILLSGAEMMEYADKQDLIQKTPYDKENDIQWLNGAGNRIQIKPGMFYLVYPMDGHKPCCHETIPTPYKKVVVKIKVDKLIHRAVFR